MKKISQQSVSLHQLFQKTENRLFTYDVMTAGKGSGNGTKAVYKLRHVVKEGREICSIEMTEILKNYCEQFQRFNCYKGLSHFITISVFFHIWIAISPFDINLVVNNGNPAKQA